MTTSRENKSNFKIIIQYYFTTLITFLTLSCILVHAVQSKLPRNHLPHPNLTDTFPANLKIKIDTRQIFNSTGISALSALVIMQRGRTTINPRVTNLCRTGKKTTLAAVRHYGHLSWAQPAFSIESSPSKIFYWQNHEFIYLS